MWWRKFFSSSPLSSPLSSLPTGGEKGGGVGLWMEQVANDPRRHHPTTQLKRNERKEVDVAIIGGGFTSLWSAYYLKRHNPSLKVAIFESGRLGDGASGRNGGWVIGGLLGLPYFLRNSPPSHHQQIHHLVNNIPEEVEKVIKKEKIECHFQRGGMLYAACRYNEQENILREEYEEMEELGGVGEGWGYEWLSKEEVEKKVKSLPNVQGGLFSPHCATIQPALLVLGLGETIRKLGVEVYEHSPVQDINWEKRELITNSGGEVRFGWAVPAVEGFLGEINESGNEKSFKEETLGRCHLCVQSLIIATEPIPPSIWEEKLGFEGGIAFGDASRMVTYAQRTQDNRLVFGVRGSYLFGGKERKDFTLTEEEVQTRKEVLEQLFPPLKGVKITHGWGGNLALPRRFRMHVVFDEERGVVMSGGYGGEGVGAANLGGRTIADLILGRESELVGQPWVLRQSIRDLPQWEPEPIPWIGYHSLSSAFVWEDRILSNPSSSTLLRRSVVKAADLLESFMS